MRRAATHRGRLFALLLGLAGGADAAEPVRFQREDVLGTSFEMTVEDTPASAQAALDAALAEVRRLDGLLSTWRPDSELSRFNASTAPQALAPEVREVLQLCEQWREQTEGMFSCRLGGLIERWREAARSGELPQRADMRAQAVAAAQAAFDPGASGPLRRPAEVRFDVDGLAKGYIIDHALARARAAAPKARAIKIDIGGDAVYWQVSGNDPPWRVAVADARHPRDNGPAVAVLELHSRAIAASGHASRGFQVGRRWFSHIIDPFSGWPVQFAPSATVTADDAASADALATALSVQPIRDGLQLAGRLPGVESLILSDTGIAFVTPGWHALLAADSGGASHLRADERLVLDYEIPTQDVEHYRAPYLAIWISRPDGEAVRQLLVLGDRSHYLAELPQWWRSYGRDDISAISGIARPTRMPGRYSVAWDGRDDQGRAAAGGDYVVHVEAAREHGGHEVLELPFALDQRHAVHAQRHGASEIGRIMLDSRP